MSLRIVEAPPSDFDEYARVPIGFEVRHRLTVAAADQRHHLAVESVPAPYLKDYDTIPGNHPTDWPRRFEVSRWGVLIAQSNGARVGGAVVVHDAPGLELLGEHPDAALLWDIRVEAALRGRGIGRRLFCAAESWAVARGARWLAIETQDVNLPACRFYERQGCELVAANAGVYQDCPDEVQLIWRKALTSATETG